MEVKRKTTTSSPLCPDYTGHTVPAPEPQASGHDVIESTTGPSESQQVGIPEPSHDVGSSSSSNSGAGLFNGSSNIDVHGGHFNQTMGHHTNVIINVNQQCRDENTLPYTTSGGTSGISLPTPDHISSTISPQSIINNASRATVSITDHPPERISSRVLFSVGNGNEIYEQHLQTKRRGFPLWIPEPNQRLPVSYRRKGVSIGDVGIITPSGGFSFLFNMCLPSDHPINPRILPEGFSPIYPPIDDDNIREFPEFKPGSYIASSSIEVSQSDSNINGMTFQTSASEAAILTMPDGAIAQDLENMARFRAYAAANIENWYRYANGVKGREAKNGDIRLVIGWDKAPSWGMAALTNMTQERVCYLKFKPVEDLSSHRSVPPYTWEYSGLADVRVGPNSDDIEEMRRRDPDPSPIYTNQCLFIRTLNPTLDENTWDNLNQELALSLMQEFSGYRYPGLSKASNSSGQSSVSQTQANSQSFKTSSGVQTSLNADQVIGHSAIVDGTIISSVTVTIDPDVRRTHPSEVINKILRELVPTARVIITRDQDWFPFVDESSLIPNVAKLREKIKSDYSIISDEDVTYLEPKIFDNLPHSTKSIPGNTEVLSTSIPEHDSSSTTSSSTTSSSSVEIPDGRSSASRSLRSPIQAFSIRSSMTSLSRTSLSPATTDGRSSAFLSLRPPMQTMQASSTRNARTSLSGATTDGRSSTSLSVRPPMQVHSIRSSTTSGSTLVTANDIQIGGDSTDTIIAIVAEVGEALSHLPYIQPLCSLILQFVLIRNQVKMNKDRCQEIIDKVLRKSKIIYERLLEISHFEGNVRDKLQRLERSLLGYQRVLQDVFKVLESNLNRVGFFRMVADRGVDELNICDRLVDSIHSDIMLDIVMEIKMGQMIEVPSPIESRKRLPSLPISAAPACILPPKPRLMVERGAVLERLVNMFIGSDSSRIAILGDEGIGKTTCALYALHDDRIAEHFTARYYLSCEGITNARSLLVAVANMLHIPPTQPSSNLLSSISRVFRTSTTVLCFDNFETPWEPSHSRNEVEEILASISVIPNLSLIVNIRGTEKPSTVAWSAPLPPLNKLHISGAEAIVHNIADVRTIDQNIRQLLETVEGIPLAITLISNLLREGVETSSSLWKRWVYMERRQESVWGEDVKSVQMSKIDAALAISINSPQMKKRTDANQILTMLSLLPDGFSSAKDDLENLFGFLDMTDVHKCIGTLHKLALARIDETSTPHRIRILPPVEFYCQNFLTSEVEVGRQKLTDYYVDIMISAGPPTSSSENMEIVREIRNMHSIFRSRYNAGTNRLDESALQKLIKASYFLTLWSTHLGYLPDDIPQFAIQASSHLPIPRARCLLALCGVYRKSERYNDAERCCREALAIFQDAGDLPGQGDANSMLSGIFADKGDPHKGEEMSNQAREVAALARRRKQLDKDEESGKDKLTANKGSPNTPRWQIALIYLQLGTPTVYLTRNRLNGTIDTLYRALELYEKDRNPMGQATARFHIAFAYLLTNELNHARRIVEDSLALCSQVVTQLANHAVMSSTGMMFNDLNSESEMQSVFYTLLGHILIREDRLVEAKAILKKAVKKKAAYSITPVMRLGWLYLRQNKLDKAEKTFNDLQKRCRTLKFWEEEHETLGYQGIIHLRRGNLDAAEDALKESRRRGLLLYAEIDVLQILGDVYIKKDKLQLAEEILAHALRMQTQIDSAFGQGNVLRSMGDLHARRGKFAEAMSAYEGARTFHRTARWVSEEMEDVERIAFLHRRQRNAKSADEAISEVRRLKALMLIL